MLVSVSTVLILRITMHMTVWSQSVPCGIAHHRLLHKLTNVPKPRIRSKVPEREAPSQINPLSTLFYLATLYTNVLGKTALARIKSAWSGLEKTARVMFDDGFDKTCIRKVLADELRLDGTKRSSGGSNFQTECGKACYKPQGWILFGCRQRRK